MDMQKFLNVYKISINIALFNVLKRDLDEKLLKIDLLKN